MTRPNTLKPYILTLNLKSYIYTQKCNSFKCILHLIPNPRLWAHEGPKLRSAQPLKSYTPLR